MKNTNTAIAEPSIFTPEINHLHKIINNHPSASPVYLKDGAEKHQFFIKEQRKNIKQLHDLKLHLQTTGKICPKAWHWGRFYKSFHPLHESYWLTNWWETTDKEKRLRFNQQISYLARQTIRFKDAYKFLLEIEDTHWHFKVQDIV